MMRQYQLLPHQRPLVLRVLGDRAGFGDLEGGGLWGRKRRGVVAATSLLLLLLLLLLPSSVALLLLLIEVLLLLPVVGQRA